MTAVAGPSTYISRPPVYANGNGITGDIRPQQCMACLRHWPWVTFPRQKDGLRDLNQTTCQACLGNELEVWNVTFLEMARDVVKARRRYGKHTQGGPSKPSLSETQPHNSHQLQPRASSSLLPRPNIHVPNPEAPRTDSAVPVNQAQSSYPVPAIHSVPTQPHHVPLHPLDPNLILAHNTSIYPPGPSNGVLLPTHQPYHQPPPHHLYTTYQPQPQNAMPYPPGHPYYRLGPSPRYTVYSMSDDNFLQWLNAQPDPIRTEHWIRANYAPAPGYSVKQTDVYNHYRSYCAQAGLHQAMSGFEFIKLISVMWQGLGVRLEKTSFTVVGIAPLATIELNTHRVAQQSLPPIPQVPQSQVPVNHVQSSGHVPSVATSNTAVQYHSAAQHHSIPQATPIPPQAVSGNESHFYPQPASPSLHATQNPALLSSRPSSPLITPPSTSTPVPIPSTTHNGSASFALKPRSSLGAVAARVGAVLGAGAGAEGERPSKKLKPLEVIDLSVDD